MNDYQDDALVEKLWRDLDGEVSRQVIAGVVSKVATRFEDATVTAFVPIFIRRRALEQLRGLVASTKPMTVSGAPMDDRVDSE